MNVVQSKFVLFAVAKINITRGAAFLVPRSKTISTTLSAARSFGCEIELLCDSSNTVYDISNAIIRSGEQVIIPSHQIRQTTTAWKLVRDVSLPANRSIEVVSPILQGENGRLRLKRTVEWINHYSGIGVDKRTGYHVHIGLEGIRFEGVRRLSQNWVKYEDAIDLILPPSRREDTNRLIRSVRNNSNFKGKTNKQVNDRIGRTKNMQQLRDLMNPGNRYYKFNLRTGSNRNTVEFRAHSGTREPGKMIMWIRFLVEFIEASARKNAPDNFLDIRAPVYKFKRLFMWVVCDTTLKNYYNQRRIKLDR